MDYVPELATPTCKYIPRNALFRHESILLRGRWSEESVRRYCVAHAEKQGYDREILDCEIEEAKRLMEVIKQAMREYI